MMSNLTITIDAQILKQARIRALQEGTSVNAEVRHFLEDYSHARSAASQAIRKVLEIAEKNPCSLGDRTWRREDLYDRWEQKKN